MKHKRPYKLVTLVLELCKLDGVNEIPDAIQHVIRVSGGCSVLDLNGPEVDCLLCQWGGFALYWGPRGALIQYLICK